MITKFVQGDPEKDFFEQNPQIKYFPEINKVVKEEGLERAGKIMWAIYLTEDPSSKFYPMHLLKKRELVQHIYLEDEEFDWEQYKELIEAYPEYAMSHAKRRYKRLSDKFDDLVHRLEDETDVTTLVRMYTNLEKILEGLDKAAKKVEKEEEDFLKARGGHEAGFYGRQTK